MARLPSGTTPFMQRPTQRADILALGKTPKRLLKVSGKHFGSQKQANIRNRPPASSTKSLSTAPTHDRGHGATRVADEVYFLVAQSHDDDCRRACSERCS